MHNMQDRLKFTVKAWPVVAAATIGICFLTKTVAGWFGIDIPDQMNVEIVRQWGLHCFDSLRNFATFAFLLVQVLVLLPIIAEFIFRWMIFRLPSRIVAKHAQDGAQRGAKIAFMVVSSVLFSAAHYIAQPFPDAAFIALFFFGLAQCWLYAKTGSIWCPMLNHALFNTTNLVLLFVVPDAA